MKSKHKYRTSVYLGKENYEKLNSLATDMGLSVSQIVRVMLDTGIHLAESVDRKESK